MRALLSPFLLLVLLHVAIAELPPSAYESMQASAPESLEIQVLRVDIAPGNSESKQEIQVMATVEEVIRTASGLKPGDVLNITYSHEERPPGWVGPGQVPILALGGTHVAYLKKMENALDYAPAAGAMSFRNF